MYQPTTETGIIIALLTANIVQLILQLAQMYFGNRQSTKDLLIKDLQERLTNMQTDFQSKITNMRIDFQSKITAMEENVKDGRDQIRKLEATVFDITKEKAYLDGQLQATQKQKELLVKSM